MPGAMPSGRRCARAALAHRSSATRAGLVADARVLAKYMRTECINYRYVYDEPMQVGSATDG